MRRTTLIVGNWKMFKTISETVDFCRRLKEELSGMAEPAPEVAVAPPFTALHAAAEALRGSSIAVSSQDVFWAETGAFTGEISSLMLKDAGCRFAIIGHSERRQYFGETDEGVNKKAAAAMKSGLTPIVCVGETLAERQGGTTFSVVERQTRRGLKDLPVKDARDLVVAYEPVWAIGTGQTASPEQAQEVHATLRKLLGQILEPTLAQGVRLLYGGSVKPENIGELMGKEDVDGALVGGASLDPGSFAKIVKGSMKK
jgi:triosephosphate isomerase